MNAVTTDTLDLQRSIHREKILRARSMSEEERLAATLDQIELAFEWMLEGVRQQEQGVSEEQARRILVERLDRQRRREDQGLFILAPAAA